MFVCGSLTILNRNHRNLFLVSYFAVADPEGVQGVRANIPPVFEYPVKMK